MVSNQMALTKISRNIFEAKLNFDVTTGEPLDVDNYEKLVQARTHVLDAAGLLHQVAASKVGEVKHGS